MQSLQSSSNCSWARADEIKDVGSRSDAFAPMAVHLPARAREGQIPLTAPPDDGRMRVAECTVIAPVRGRSDLAARRRRIDDVPRVRKWCGDANAELRFDLSWRAAGVAIDKNILTIEMHLTAATRRVNLIEIRPKVLRDS